jgi:hypothetical protein
MTDFRDQPSSIRPGEELDPGKLEPFLRTHFPDEAQHLSVEQFPSGHSNPTYSLRLGHRQMVLRRVVRQNSMQHRKPHSSCEQRIGRFGILHRFARSEDALDGS